MTEAVETIWQTETHRLVLVNDYDPVMPYDDGSTPVLAVSGSRFTDYRQMRDLTSFEVPASIEVALQDAFEEHLRSREVFERYLRIWHGTTSVEWFTTSGGSEYVTFDTAAWREAMGITDRKVKANASEFEAWADGDVYGAVVQRLDSWENQTTGEMREEWDEVDSCYGFYGGDYARTGAVEHFPEADYGKDA